MAKRTILTDENVLTLRARGKADVAWSDVNSPLILRVQGAKRSYVVRTRLNGKMRRFTIGAPSTMPLVEAHARSLPVWL